MYIEEIKKGRQNACLSCNGRKRHEKKNEPKGRLDLCGSFRGAASAVLRLGSDAGPDHSHAAPYH